MPYDRPGNGSGGDNHPARVVLLDSRTDRWRCDPKAQRRIIKARDEKGEPFVVMAKCEHPEHAGKFETYADEDDALDAFRCACIVAFMSADSVTVELMLPHDSPMLATITRELRNAGAM